jgi:tetratricopeptide (TPR) repeat protein
MAGRIIPFRWREHRLSPKEGWAMAERVLAMPISERLERANEIRLEDSELLLAVCEVLRPRLESSPMEAKAEAEFFYGFLDKPVRRIGLFDEREYYLGEFALTAGTACRVLFHREEARRWFDRAEASFTQAANGLAHVARVGYQRLALAAEERRFDEVFDLAPLWAESFRSMGLPDDALKCRFLEGAALRETGRFAESVEVFRAIYTEADKRGNSRLAAHAATSLAQYLRLLGSFDEALEYARKALPLLKQLDMRMVLVKLKWSVANILREQRKLHEALLAYREALEEAQAIGMRGDVAALHLVLADVMLDVGQDRQAEWEVRAALPIIDEERMVPEGFAALDLLRQALRYRQIDRKALRELHGYFGDSQA